MPHEVFTGNVTFSNNILVAMAPAAGDPASFTVRKSVNPKLLDTWSNFQAAAGLSRLRSTLFHDNTQGLRFQVNSAKLPVSFLAYGDYQPLQSQDGIIVEAQDADAGGNIEVTGLWIHYDDLPGSQGRYVDENVLRAAAVQLFIQEVALTPGVGGGYTGSKAINGTFDLMKAETDYGALGMIFGGVAAGASPDAGHAGLKGPDTGQLRCPVPAIAPVSGGVSLTTDFWALACREYGLPLVPIINAANKAATTLDSASSQAGVAYTVDIHMLQLTPEADKQATVTTGPASVAAPGTGAAGQPPRGGGGANLPVGRRVAPMNISRNRAI